MSTTPITTTPFKTTPLAIRLRVLAFIAIGAITVLCLTWAALLLHTQQKRSAQLEVDLQKSRTLHRAALSAASASEMAETKRLAERLILAEKSLDQSRELLIEREKELNEIISFLRTENAASEETIQRLSTIPESKLPEKGTKAAARKKTQKD